RGYADEAGELISCAITDLENLGAIPDLCEAYIAMAKFKLHVSLPVEARFYLAEAETSINRINYDSARMQLHSAWGEFYEYEERNNEAEISYQKALDSARKLTNLLEEGRSLHKLGSLARIKKDFVDAEVKFQEALRIFNELKVPREALSLYYDIVSLYIAQEKYDLAEEVIVLLEQQSKLLGYYDLNIMALVAWAECERKTGKLEKAKEDYYRALRLARDYGERTCVKTNHLLISKVLDFLVESSSSGLAGIAAVPTLASYKSKLQKKEYHSLLDGLSALDVFKN
ncbi:MAG: tetratricopeptide repeat protein, partial [Methanotrichaceae archaeon]|nr:tetratricopeptide repeat protein [Methanotrichaceae archaeon]